VLDFTDESKITELGTTCQDFYIYDSTLKVQGIFLRANMFRCRGKKGHLSGKACSLPGILGRMKLCSFSLSAK
jgi:hypothetical protein